MEVVILLIDDSIAVRVSLSNSVPHSKLLFLKYLKVFQKQQLNMNRRVRQAHSGSTTLTAHILFLQNEITLHKDSILK